MYELQGIDQSVIDNFFKIIADTLDLKNWESFVLVALKKTVHEVFPGFSFPLLQNYMAKQFQDIHNFMKYNVHSREFKNEGEAIETYQNTYDKLINELMDSENDQDKTLLNYIHYSYELLKYDQVTFIDGEKFLSSFVNLYSIANNHLEAYEKREKIQKAKPSDKNIDIATNSGKTVKDRVAFLNAKYEVDLIHPFVHNSETELQAKVVQEYTEDTRMMARCIHFCAELSKSKIKNFEINSIGKMSQYLNSDQSIPKRDIYISWYASSIAVYRRLSKNKIPNTKALKMAQLSSYVLFPQLKDKKPIVSLEKLQRPIRERSFMNGIRFYEFTDNRLKIERSQEDIEFTEYYLKLFTSNLKSLSKS